MNSSLNTPIAAGALEGRHGAAQLVGLAGCEAGADDGDLHRLFLEQRHAEVRSSTAFELRAGIARPASMPDAGA